MSSAEEFECRCTCDAHSHFVEYEENAEKCDPVTECGRNVFKINFAFIFASRRRQFASVNEFFFANFENLVCCWHTVVVPMQNENSKIRPKTVSYFDANIFPVATLGAAAK